MKIALMFVGQPRYVTDERLQQQWVDIVNSCRDAVDVYAYWWDSCSNMTPTNKYEKFVKLAPISDEDKAAIESISQRLDMKSCIVESPKLMDSIAGLFHSNPYIMGKRIDADSNEGLYATMGQWFGLNSAVNIAKSNENYDYYLKCRWDLNLDPFFLNQVVQNLKGNESDIFVNELWVNNGIMCVSDLLTIIPRKHIDEFTTNLIPGIAAQINSLFCDPVMPIAIQEPAFYRYLQKMYANVNPLHAGTIEVSRGEFNSTEWMWPNYHS